MKLYINDNEEYYGELSVTLDLDDVSRSFSIVNNEKKVSFKRGDKVEIHDNNGLLLIKGEIEYVKMKSETYKEYVGRNNARFIIDCYADKTIQFTNETSLNKLLTEVAGKFDLNVIGDSDLNSETYNRINIGTTYGEAIIDIVSESGDIITSDAEGNLIIEDEPIKSPIDFVYSQNIRHREYEENSTMEYDKVIVVSQSTHNKLREDKGGDINIANQGSFGDGVFVKVIKSKDALTNEECEKLAKKEFEKAKRASLKYTVQVDNGLGVNLNHIYLVKDSTANVNCLMRCQSIEYKSGGNHSVMTVQLERYDND